MCWILDGYGVMGIF